MLASLRVLLGAARPRAGDALLVAALLLGELWRLARERNPVLRVCLAAACAPAALLGTGPAHTPCPCSGFGRSAGTGLGVNSTSSFSSRNLSEIAFLLEALGDATFLFLWDGAGIWVPISLII